MDTGPVFFLAFLGMFVGTVTITLYVFGLFKWGYRLAMGTKTLRPMWQGILAIALAWGPVSLWPVLIDWSPFLKVGFSMAFYLLGAYPMSVGFGTGTELRKAEAKRRFRKNVDDWLGEWECEPAAHGLDERDSDEG